MNKLDLDYQELLEDILEKGVTKENRTEINTKSIFGYQIRHKMSTGFPLITTKKMYFKGIVTELLWFLRGDTNIKFLIDNGCNIWNGDAYKRFSEIRKSMLMLKPPASEDKLREYIEWYEQITTQEEFINKIKTGDNFSYIWGNLGPIYGKQWRSLDDQIDQITNLINDLKTNPDSRRLMVSAWNVGELDQMTLPPCHYGFQVYTRELSFKDRLLNYDPKGLYHNEVDAQFLDQLNIPKRAISLMWNQRSVDVPLGLPFNIASYGLLLSILGKIVNMIPEDLIGNLGDCHIYKNQIDGVKEQLNRAPYYLPQLEIEPDKLDIDNLRISDFSISEYKSHKIIKIPLTN